MQFKSSRDRGTNRSSMTNEEPMKPNESVVSMSEKKVFDNDNIDYSKVHPIDLSINNTQVGVHNTM